MRLGRPLLLGGILGLATGAGTTAAMVLGPTLIPIAGRALLRAISTATSVRPTWPRPIQGLQDLWQEPGRPTQS
jgi:hypothetical protein